MKDKRTGILEKIAKKLKFKSQDQKKRKLKKKI